MKKIFALVLFALNVYPVLAQKHFNKVKITSETDSISYALGYMLAQNMVKEGLTDYDATIVGRAFNDSKVNNSPLLSLEECKNVLQDFFNKKEQELKESQMEKEREFFAANAKKEGVKTTESGLQYKVLDYGDKNGKTPSDDDDIRIHYEGRLIDGTVFDTSYDNEEPIKLSMNYLIPGMTEGLKLMREGAKYILYIPQELGYGDYSPSEAMPAFSTLIFEIELVSVEPPSKDTEDE